MHITQQTLFPELIKHRLPTNTLSHSKRVQRWGNFIAGYSVEFVESCLNKQKSSNKSMVVLDPFCGCGTTIMAAKNFNYQSIGYELHPVFYSISKAKSSFYELHDLDTICSTMFQQTGKIEWSLDAHKFLSKMFNNENLDFIANASFGVNALDQYLKPLGITFFLKACEYACGAQTDGIYKAPTSKKKAIPFSDAIKKAYSDFKYDINSDWYKLHWANTPSARIYNHTSELITEISESCIDFCITSPPYLNNFDYSEMTRMHLYLLGWCSSWNDISLTVRNHLITNTTTALKGKKDSSYQLAAKENLPDNLIKLLQPIKDDLTHERASRAGKKEYDYLIYPYYSQIKSVLSEVYRSLKKGGEIHWVIADAALYGIHIETEEHTALLMREIGFRDVNIKHLRKRGHRWVLSKRDGSKKGLGEYHISGKK